MKILKKVQLSLLLSLLLLFFGSGCAEAAYTVTDQQLTTLETNLQTLERNNEKKQNLLAEQKAQLETAEKALSESRISNARTQKSLAKANESLKALEQEAKRKIQIKTRQRNLWILISGGLLYAYISK